MELEQIINKEVEEMNKRNVKKVLVYGDVHYPYHDDRALNVLYKYMSNYKPNIVVVNGDLVDFYTISVYDKNPDHYSLQDEIDLAKEHFKNVRKIVGNKTKIYYLEGNHEARLQKYVYRHPELDGLEALNLKKLFELDKYNINFIGVDVDYWTKDRGQLILGDTLIIHGDSKLNGASTSKYSGYSIKNTILNATQMNTIMGHIHRMAMFYHRTPTKTYVGLEHGCLSQLIGTANWQQGFVTFELYRNKLVNPKLHYIKNGKLFEDGKIYKG